MLLDVIDAQFARGDVLQQAERFQSLPPGKESFQVEFPVREKIRGQSLWVIKANFFPLHDFIEIGVSVDAMLPGQDRM